MLIRLYADRFVGEVQMPLPRVGEEIAYHDRTTRQERRYEVMGVTHFVDDGHHGPRYQGASVLLAHRDETG